MNTPYYTDDVVPYCQDIKDIKFKKQPTDFSFSLTTRSFSASNSFSALDGPRLNTSGTLSKDSAFYRLIMFSPFTFGISLWTDYQK